VSQVFQPDTAICGDYGGGGNRTRVRSRTVKSLSKHSLPLNFARPAGGLANLPSG
jgi:hypothetical protein